MMKKKILAIDDSKAMRFLLQTVLGKDYQVVTAPDGCSAMYWLTKNPLPDMIIADPQLPDMADWELIEELASSILYRDIPVLVISSVNQGETGKRCAQLNITDYYIKPFNPLHLLETVKSMLTEKKVYPGPVPVSL